MPRSFLIVFDLSIEYDKHWPQTERVNVCVCVWVALQYHDSFNFKGKCSFNHRKPVDF